VISEDASGTAQCDGGAIDVDIPPVSVIYLTGDMFKASTPPHIPGIQPCPLCDTLCYNSGGAYDAAERFPCDVDQDCVDAGNSTNLTCGTSTECLGGPDDGNPCTPGTSDETVLGQGFPTSHDCRPGDPGTDVGGVRVFTLRLTSGMLEQNAVDFANAKSVFCGYCQDLMALESRCFENNDGWLCPDTSKSDCHPQEKFCSVSGTPCTKEDSTDCPEGGCSTTVQSCRLNSDCPPSETCTNPLPETCDQINIDGCGSAVPCASDADCNDGDEYESCAQRSPGAFAEAASTRITLWGSAEGECLGDGEPHPTDLVSIFCVPPSFNWLVDPAADLPGPGAVTLQTEVILQ
jgi:hypothetical protein